MAWKEYLQERINAAPALVKEATANNSLSERAVILRVMNFADSFIQGKGDSRLVILYGLRGIGKTTILYQVYDRLSTGRFFKETRDKIPKENILYLSVDQTLLQSQYNESKSQIYEAVKNFVEQIHNQTFETLDKKLYVLIDEAQFDKNWAVAAKTIFDSSKNIFLIITGSSALALNLDTDTARRAIKEPLFPLSFMEYEIIKNRIFPTKGTAENLKKLILQNDHTAVAELNRTIAETNSKMKIKHVNADLELNEYLTLGGFPYCVNTTKEISYRRILDMINRIVTLDMPIIANYETNATPEIMRLIGSIALKPSGEISQTKLSQSLGISGAKVNSIIETLQKTHLIFAVKPYQTSPTSGLSKVFKYYFMSPTLISAIQYLNGKTTCNDAEKAIVWENAVAASLFKLCYTSGTIYNLFYDARKETNVDFLLHNPLSGAVIPFEVGLNKNETQIISAIEAYDSTHGVVISDFPEVTFNEKIIKIPLRLFLHL